MQVVLASDNRGKLREIGALLAGSGIEMVAQSAFNIASADETGTTFTENALLKARHAARASKRPAIADDSGLEVDALNGAPGVYSARFAGIAASDADNVAMLLRSLRAIPAPQRSARFRCVMVYVATADDPSPIVCTGTWEGSILDAPRGANGFGYDPVFFVPTHGCSAAELDAQTKNALSHRGQALRALVKALTALAGPR